jgi:hypothetical protein
MRVQKMNRKLLIFLAVIAVILVLAAHAFLETQNIHPSIIILSIGTLFSAAIQLLGILKKKRVHYIVILAIIALLCSLGYWSNVVG